MRYLDALQIGSSIMHYLPVVVLQSSTNKATDLKVVNIASTLDIEQSGCREDCKKKTWKYWVLITRML